GSAPTSMWRQIGALELRLQLLDAMIDVRSSSSPPRLGSQALGFFRAFRQHKLCQSDEPLFYRGPQPSTCANFVAISNTFCRHGICSVARAFDLADRQSGFPGERWQAGATSRGAASPDEPPRRLRTARPAVPG